MSEFFARIAVETEGAEEVKDAQEGGVTGIVFVPRRDRDSVVHVFSVGHGSIVDYDRASKVVAQSMEVLHEAFPSRQASLTEVPPSNLRLGNVQWRCIPEGRQSEGLHWHKAPKTP